MSEKRLSQVNQLIQKEIAELLLKKVDFPPGCLVTVIRVETSVDIAFAKVFLSVLPVSATGQVTKILDKNIYHMQKILNRRLVRRIVPKIMFRIDNTEAEAEKVDRLLDSLKKEV